MTFKYMETLKVALLLVTALSTSFVGISFYRNQQKKYQTGENILYKQGDVLGIDSDQESVSVNFDIKTQTGSPLVFGGAHSPNLEHSQAWDEIESAGITSIRKDFYLDRYIPRKITLEQYKQNINGVQNPSNWNQTEIQKVRNIFLEAKKRNMKTIGILAYSIDWLSYSQNSYGVPKDWAVYEDLAQKTYTLFRDQVDYLEIWNEPDMDFFMNVKNSGMSKEEAYYQIVKRAIPAIRRADLAANDGKRIQIGVGVMSQPTNPQYLSKILSDKELAKEIDFISYHNYEHLPEPSNGPITALLKQSGFETIPMFITEWAHTPKIKQSDPYVLTDLAIPYTGAKIIDFMNMGLAGSNYFTMQPIAPNSIRGDEGLLGFYNVNGNSVSMLPVIKTWTLLSKTLGLGTGPSKIYKNSSSAEKVLAYQNSNNEYGLALSNQTSQIKEFNFTLYGLPVESDLVLSAYLSSNMGTGRDKLGSAVVSNPPSGANFKAVVPPNSVLGIKIYQATLRDKLSL